MVKRSKAHIEKTYSSEAGMLALLEKVLLENLFEVYKEVQTPNGYCDIVATYNMPDKQIRWAIEGKMSCNEAVIGQAYANKRYFDYVSICTPKEPNWIYKDFLKSNGIGIIEVNQNAVYSGHVKGELHMYEGDQNEILPGLMIPQYRSFSHSIPRIYPNPKTNSITLHELHKLERAGKSAGERITTYKLTVIKIQEYLRGKGWVPIKTMLVDLKDDLYWSNPRNGLYNVCHWEEEKFEQKREGMVSFMKLKE